MKQIRNVNSFLKDEFHKNLNSVEIHRKRSERYKLEKGSFYEYPLNTSKFGVVSPVDELSNT